MGFVRNVVGGITGSSAADAAKSGARDQIAAGQRASDLQQPLVDFGAKARDQLLSSVLPELQLPQLQSAQDVLNNPFFKALNDQQTQNTLAQRAALGLAGSGGTEDILTRNLLQLGQGFQQQDFQNQNTNFANQLNANQRRFGQLFDLANVGNQALANQGNLIVGQGNASAAGRIGAANARAQGAQNILKLGAAAYGAATAPTD